MFNPKFSIIVADPPWKFNDKLKMSDTPRSAEANYQLMSNKDIQNLPIKDVADPNGSILVLWVPSSILQTGLDTMKSWGFEHKQTYVWVKIKKYPLIDLKKSIKKLLRKPNITYNKNNYIETLNLIIDNYISLANDLSKSLAFGMGRLFRQTHEIALIGINNNDIYKKLQNKSQRSVSFGLNEKHSKKPEYLQNSLELMFPDGKYLELFARREREKWICLGNEIGNKEDIRISLEKLINNINA